MCIRDRLHGIYYGESRYLKHWFEICPRNQYTTLDTHDGIGVVDVRDLLPDEEIEKTREHLYSRGANVKKIYSTAAYNNLDIYQINCTYYSALGDDDDAYLLARAVQFFAPGKMCIRDSCNSFTSPSFTTKNPSGCKVTPAPLPPPKVSFLSLIHISALPMGL